MKPTAAKNGRNTLRHLQDNHFGSVSEKEGSKQQCETIPSVRVEGQVVEVLLPVVAGEPTLFSVKFSDGDSDDFTFAELEPMLAEPLHKARDGNVASTESSSSSRGSGEEDKGRKVWVNGNRDRSDDCNQSISGHMELQIHNKKTVSEAQVGDDGGITERDGDDMDETESEELALTLSDSVAVPPKQLRKSAVDEMVEEVGKDGAISPNKGESEAFKGTVGEVGNQDNDERRGASIDPFHVEAAAPPKAAFLSAMHDPVALFGKVSFLQSHDSTDEKKRMKRLSATAMHMLHVQTNSSDSSHSQSNKSGSIQQSIREADGSPLFSFKPVWGS